MKLNIVLVLLIMVYVMSVFAQQGPRYAFVVGVGDYEDDGLDISGPVENAKRIASALEKVGFSVECYEDITYKKFDKEFVQFCNRIAEKNNQEAVEVVAFYFTGHGIMDADNNYLLPKDIKKSCGIYDLDGGIKLKIVINRLKITKCQFSLVMIEACRVRTSGDAIEKFVSFTPPEGVAVMMAADEGQKATIGLFSNSLIEEIEKPGIEIDQIMGNVKESVYNKSKKNQLPTYLNNKIGKFYFIPSTEDPLEPKMKEEKERIKNKVNELVKLPSLPKVSKAITQKEYDRYVLQAEEMAKKYEKIEEEIGKYEEKYKEKTFYETLENQLLKASNYIDRQRTLLERAEMYSNRNSSEPSKPKNNSPEPVQIYGLPENIWNECRVQENGEYILDMTTKTWRNLSWQDQMKYAKIYQEGYAKEKNVEVRKEIEIGEIKGWFSTQKVSIALRLIPPGAYLIGSPANEPERYDNESQTRIVIAEGYYLSETEVTQEQWKVIMGNNPSHFSGSKCPVEQVSWLEARDYCLKLTEKTGKEFRMPLEVEWEYGCRGGTTTAFNIGANISPNEINYDGNHPYTNGAKGIYRKKTAPCGSLNNQNAWGLYDMHGNVWEWCMDEYKEKYTSSSHHPKNIVISQYKDIKNGSQVNRGGSWYNYARFCRSANRSISGVVDRFSFLGFRLSAQQ